MQPSVWFLLSTRFLFIESLPIPIDISMHFNSVHPFPLKRATLRGLWLRAQHLLRNHPIQLAQELRHLRSTFANPANAYPEITLRKWFRGFERELLRKPALLTVPVRAPIEPEVPNGEDTVLVEQTDFANSREEEIGNLPDTQHSQQMDLGTDIAPWIPTLIGPYYPGLSEKLCNVLWRTDLE